MARTSSKRPVCIVISGPNGAGKTTFAREFLPKDARVVHFLNSHLIASGFSPLHPELAALVAGRLMLKELDRLAKARLDFRSWKNFQTCYRLLADAWAVYDNSGDTPRLLERGP